MRQCESEVGGESREVIFQQKVADSTGNQDYLVLGLLVLVAAEAPL